MYSQSLQEGHIGMCIKLQECICEVDKEIKKAEREYLEIKSTEYDLPTIISKQESLAKKYKEKLKTKKRKEYN
jgi:hypothetical protein